MEEDEIVEIFRNENVPPLNCKINSPPVEVISDSSIIYISDTDESFLCGTPSRKASISIKNKINKSTDLKKKKVLSKQKKAGFKSNVKGRLNRLQSLLHKNSKIIKDKKVKNVKVKLVKEKINLEDDDCQIVFEWSPAQLVAESQGIENWQVKNVIDLFDNECTLPFIARYRKEKTGSLDAEKLREIQNSYTQLKTVQEKVSSVIKSKALKLPETHKKALLKATTVAEVEHLTAAFKEPSKGTYAGRARKLGLGPMAEDILNNEETFQSLDELMCFVIVSKEGVKSISEIQEGLQHIIADIISKDSEVLGFVKDLMLRFRPTLECTEKKISKKSGNAKPNKKLKVGTSDSKNCLSQERLVEKYHNYLNYKNFAANVRPHQVLAINRGEKQSALVVKIELADGALAQFTRFCWNKWKCANGTTPRVILIQKSIEDSWKRLVRPFLERRVRSQLTERAEIGSVDVFTSNLKKLLLTPPFRGKPILAVDPGFHNGCKICVCSSQGQVLHVSTIYPFRGPTHGHNANKNASACVLKQLINTHDIEYLAIGNGTACRQIEELISNLIKSSFFHPRNIQYIIVNESGASQYSVSKEATAEFPDMDPNHISAISLARRVQDPLLEYVKVHPQHLGVGMYQHDISEKILNNSLDSVMVECVSFVGLDINVASEFALRKLSGMNKARAANLVEHRKKKGPFLNRAQIKEVKGIGSKTFEQCAGFVKIIPQTLKDQLKTLDPATVISQIMSPYDQTLIHPESYEIADKFLSLIPLNNYDIGQEFFRKKVQEFSRNNSLSSLGKQLNCSSQTIKLIIEGLTEPLDYDIRAQFSKPIFRKGVKCMKDVSIGSILTGVVSNVPHFGAFVDLGLGNDGLIHESKMNGMRVSLGDSVEVRVMSLDIQRGRISLKLMKVL